MPCDSRCYASAVSSVRLFPTIINDAAPGVLQLRKGPDGVTFYLQLLIATWLQYPSLACRVRPLAHHLQHLAAPCSNDDERRPSDRLTGPYRVPVTCLGPVLRVLVHVRSGSLGPLAGPVSRQFWCRFVLLVAVHVPVLCLPCLTTL